MTKESGGGNISTPEIAGGPPPVELGEDELVDDEVFDLREDPKLELPDREDIKDFGGLGGGGICTDGRSGSCLVSFAGLRWLGCPFVLTLGLFPVWREDVLLQNEIKS